MALACLVSVWMLANTAARAENETRGGHDAIEFLTPQRNQAIPGQSVSVTLRFEQGVDPASFRARLNGHEVTGRFAVSATGASAVLTVADGLKTKSKDRDDKSGAQDHDDDLVPNHIVVVARQNFEPHDDRDDHEARRVVAERRFFMKAGGTNASQVTATIRPTGGTVMLPGYGTVTFPAAAFATSQPVTLSLTSDPGTANTFNTTTVLFDSGPRAANELHVNTGLVAPAADVDVAFTVPATLLTSMPAGYEPVLFVLVPEQGGDEMYHFELLYPSYDSQTQILSLTLPSYVFGNGLTADSSYETVIIVGSNKIRTNISLTLDQVGFDAAALANGTCESRPDVHKVLAPPLDGKLAIASPFGPRPTFSQTAHFGVDYRTLNYATLSYGLPDPSLPPGAPVTGLPVRSMDDGTIEHICDQIVGQTSVCDQPIPQNAVLTGWGHYIVVKHNDGSKVLYAHLTPGSEKLPQNAKITRGEVIALSGESGLNLSVPGVGPHLHVELVPNGLDPKYAKNNWAKVNVAPCVHRDLYTAFDLNVFGPPVPPGYVYRYDLTSDYGTNFTLAGWNVPTSSQYQNGPVGVAGFNRNYYAAGGPASFNGTVFAPFGDPAPSATSITANRQGVYVGETPYDVGLDYVFHFYSLTGVEDTSKRFTFPGASFFQTYAKASDTRLCVAADNYSGNGIYDITGPGAPTLVTTLRGAVWPQDGDYFGLPCAVTNDRIYVAVSVKAGFNFETQIRVYDSNGNFIQNLGEVPPAAADIAVDERNLFVSDDFFGNIYVYSRAVVRDQYGVIQSDIYTPAGVITTPPTGWPTGLGLE